MAKNIVLCCDGTANEFAQDRTNVVKLFFTLVHEPAVQVAYYHPGLGTMEPPGALGPIARRATKLLGQAMGYGLEADVRDAYVFLMDRFEPGDRVFFFGFSRGAYTVRAVAALLHMYGLIRSGNETLVPYAIRMMMAINLLQKRSDDDPTKKELLSEYFDLAAQFRQHFSITECKPHFVGVWDTVSSVGWIENPVRLPYSANNPDIAIGRHALAIDERRAFFRSNLWHPRPPNDGPKDIKQVWFAGVHCDVGGGYPESESGLSKMALEWMIREANAAGLATHPAKIDLVLGRAGGGYCPPDPNAGIHNSLTPAWWPAEFIPKRHYNWATGTEERRANLFHWRTIPEGAFIHDSVFQRPNYKPRLPQSFTRVS